MKVKIKPLSETFKMPIKGSEQAACYDCYADRIEFSEDGMVTCFLGFATEIEPGYKGVIVPRSNISKYGWCLCNSIGIVDSDFRNEWQVRFRPLEVISKSYDKTFVLYTPVEYPIIQFPYQIGERCCQIYFEKIQEPEFIISGGLSDTKRDLGGFGSSGLK